MGAIDHQILLLLNGLVGRSRVAFECALLLCGQTTLALSVMALLALWWTDAEGRRHRGLLSGRDLNADRYGLLESRRRVVMLSFAVAGAFIATRLVSFATDLPRPLGREQLLVPIEAARWDDLVRGMTGFGAFPSDHAALFFALAVGLFAWSRAAGIVGLGAAALFSLARVAVGFHYPVDVLAGGAIGASAAAAARVLTPRCTRVLDAVVGLFDHSPQVMYPVVFVVALDFTQHFRMLAGAVFATIFKLMGMAA